MQHTLKKPIEISGIGLHSGKNARVRLVPAAADQGIVFIRTDVSGDDNVIPALWNRVVDTRLCTLIANEQGISAATIEHLMAALRGCGVDNALVELDGPEVPVLDGSAMPFVEMIDDAGTVRQDLPRRAIRVLKEVSVTREGKCVRLLPAEESVFSGDIDFSHPQIGRQHFKTTLYNGNFRHDLAASRTFGFLQDVQEMQKNGLALGGSMDNAIVLDDTRVLNPDGVRSEDEFVRHKILDAVGDLYLAGGPVIGAYEGFKAGHALNNALLHALFADPLAWERVDMYSDNGGKDAAAVSAPDRRHQSPVSL